MLRTHGHSKQLLQQLQHARTFSLKYGPLHSKDTSVQRQGKIMSKLFGNRMSGSKKRWFPTPDTTSKGAVFSDSNFGKPSGRGGKNDTRRMSVLNKLFMKHITDLLATGEVSEAIVGKGLQVSRVKISQDFAFINVFWMGSGDVHQDMVLEQELKRCSGLLRHELSQLCLMAVVPRIKFVHDKTFANLAHVESLLRNMDLSAAEDEEDSDIEQLANDVVKQEFYGTLREPLPASSPESICADDTKIASTLPKLPEMRHDVLGLDHRGIMFKILTKMRKSKQAWDQHNQNLGLKDDLSQDSTIQSATQLARINEKLAAAAAKSKEFDDFLARRREQKNTPERKKYRRWDECLDLNAANERIDDASDLPPRQRQLYEAEDYLQEDEENELK